MNHHKIDTLYGFNLGKHTYYWKKKKLYRNNLAKDDTMLKLKVYGSSLRYKIQGKRYSERQLCNMSRELVNVKSAIPF